MLMFIAVREFFINFILCFQESMSLSCHMKLWSNKTVSLAEWWMKIILISQVVKFTELHLRIMIFDINLYKLLLKDMFKYNKRNLKLASLSLANIEI